MDFFLHQISCERTLRMQPNWSKLLKLEDPSAQQRFSWVKNRTDNSRPMNQAVEAWKLQTQPQLTLHRHLYNKNHLLIHINPLFLYIQHESVFFLWSDFSGLALELQALSAKSAQGTDCLRPHPEVNDQTQWRCTVSSTGGWKYGSEVVVKAWQRKKKKVVEEEEEDN